MQVSVDPFRVFLVILVYYSIGIMAETVFLPAFKFLAIDFDVNIIYIESAYGYFFYTFGLSMFFYGPFSDIFGRKYSLLLGSFISLLGCISLYSAWDYYSLVFSILLLGTGFGAGGMLCRAVARDLFFGEKLLLAMTRVNIIFIIFPTLSPIIGSYFVTYLTWREIVLFLGFLNICSLFYTYNSFVETATLSLDTKVSSILRSYKELFLDKVFMLQVLIGLVSGSIVMVYEAKTAYIFQEYLQLTPIDQAFYGLFPIFGVILATLLIPRIVRFVGGSFALLFVNIYLFLLMILLGYLSYHEILTLWHILAIFTQCFFCNTFTYSLVNAQAMESCVSNIGRGSAMIGGLQNFGIGVIVSLIPIFYQKTVFDVSIMMIFLAFILLLLNILKFFYERNSKSMH